MRNLGLDWNRSSSTKIIKEMTKLMFRSLLGGKGDFLFAYACLSSFIKYCKNEFELQIFEDGTLSTYQVDELVKLPRVTVIKKVDRDGIVNEKLTNFPNCQLFRKKHLFSYKILDTMLYDDYDFYYIDSDILFFNDFKFEYSYPENPVFMDGRENSYSFSIKKLKHFNWRIFPRINAGFMYFPKKLFKLENLENIIEKNFDETDINHAWAEQTMWAFLASSLNPYHFHSNQIVMAHPHTRTSHKTIAIHLVTPYRYQYKRLIKTNRKINKLELSVKSYPIISKLTPSSYLISIYYYKMQRKLYRYLKIVPPMEIGGQPFL